MERQQFDPDEGRFVGLEQFAEATPERQLSAETEFDKRVSYALNSETHLWLVIMTHFASDQMLRAFAGEAEEGDLPILDTESIAMRPAVTCFICEEPWNPRLRHRKCKPSNEAVAAIGRL